MAESGGPEFRGAGRSDRRKAPHDRGRKAVGFGGPVPARGQLLCCRVPRSNSLPPISAGSCTARSAAFSALPLLIAIAWWWSRPPSIGDLSIVTEASDEIQRRHHLFNL